jgi:LysM repeat protein
MTHQVYDRGPREHAMGTVSGSYYTVAAGDTFYSIGLRFGLPYTAITRANGLPDDAWVTAGTRLLIPGLAPVPPGVYDRGPRPHAMGTVSGSYYTVAAGDTFYSIGLRFGLPYTALTRANGLPDDAWVTAGTRLLIPGLKPAPPPPPPEEIPRLGINKPTYGSTVYVASPLTVEGVGSGLRSNRIVVRLKNHLGSAVSQIETRADPSGNWRVTFAAGLPVAPNTPGAIEAEAPSNNLRMDIAVNFR